MSVKELIEKLKQFPEDMEVCYDYDGGWSACEIEKVYTTKKYNGGEIIGVEVVILK